MFVYCFNNPFNNCDSSGQIVVPANYLGGFGSNTSRIGWKDIVGAEYTESVVVDKTVMYVVPRFAPVSCSIGTSITKTTYSSRSSSSVFTAYCDYVGNSPSSSTVGVDLSIGDYSLSATLGLEDIGVSLSKQNGDSSNAVSITANLKELQLGIENSYSKTKDNVTVTSYSNSSINGWFLLMLLASTYTGQLIPT